MPACAKPISAWKRAEMAAGKPILEIDDLQAWYGDSHVLHGVTLNVCEGEPASLIGRHGVDKPATLRSIVGIVRKRRGSIRLHGVELTTMPMHTIARLGLGYVPEE